MGLSVGIAQVEVFASAAARAAVLEAEQATRIAAGLAPAGATLRPTRLSELLVTPDTGRARVHAVLRDVADAQAQLHALQAAAIARLAELQPAQEPLPGARRDDPADRDRPDDWVADEVAVVLGISVGSASSLVAKQRALVEQLPQVWAAAADGVIDVRRCQVLVDTLADRKQSAGGGLADDLVDTIAAQGLGWIAEGIGPTPLADRIGGAVIAADPAEAARRAERRKRRQNVTTIGQGDGLASLRTDLADAADVAQEIEVIDALAARRAERRKRRQNVTTIGQGDGLASLRTDLADAADVAQEIEVIDALAATMRKGGDERAMGQLRVAAHHQLVTRPWEPLPAEVAAARWHLTLRADLDDLGPLTNPPTDQPPTDADDVDEATDADGVDDAIDTDRPDTTLDGAAAGSGVGAIGGLPVSPVAVAELLARYDALLAVGARGRVQGGDVWFEILDATGRLRAITSPAEARAALRRGTGLGPPPRIADYEPNAAQTRFVKARDRHCRFPGCSRPAEYVDLDHAITYDHDDPAAGGPTCVTNLVCLCRRHHRLKTHAPGWTFAMDPDGTLHVTPPGGRTRTTRPAGIAQVDMSTPTSLDVLTDLLGPTPKRFRSPTPEQRAARRAATADRARLAAEIESELDAALARRTGAQTDDQTAAGAADQTGAGTSAAGDDPEDDPPPF
ncbi:HNH endonuclease signature motif containing protein [Klenkia terrae]